MVFPRQIRILSRQAGRRVFFFFFLPWGKDFISKVAIKMFPPLVEMINTPLVRQYFPTRPHTNQATQMGGSETLRKQNKLVWWVDVVGNLSSGLSQLVVEVIWVLNEVENPRKMYDYVATGIKAWRIWWKMNQCKPKPKGIIHLLFWEPILGRKKHLTCCRRGICSLSN